MIPCNAAPFSIEKGHLKVLPSPTLIRERAKTDKEQAGGSRFERKMGHPYTQDLLYCIKNKLRMSQFDRDGAQVSTDLPQESVPHTSLGAEDLGGK